MFQGGSSAPGVRLWLWFDSRLRHNSLSESPGYCDLSDFPIII